MSRSFVWRCALFALCTSLLTPIGSFAQTPTFAVEGVVSDAQQAVLPGVTVTIQNTATGLTRVVVTDEGGRFVVRALPPEGQYTRQGRDCRLRHRGARRTCGSTPARTWC